MERAFPIFVELQQVSGYLSGFFLKSVEYPGFYTVEDGEKFRTVPTFRFMKGLQKCIIDCMENLISKSPEYLSHIRQLKSCAKPHFDELLTDSADAELAKVVKSVREGILLIASKVERSVASGELVQKI